MQREAVVTEKLSGDNPPEDKQATDSKVSRRRRFFIWAGSVGTALVVAIATAIGTGIGQDLLSKATGTSPSGTLSSGPSPSGTLASGTSSSGSPVKIDATILGRDGSQGGTYVFPHKRIYSAVQLGKLNQLGPSQPEYGTWFRSQGAVDPDWSSIKLVIQGNRNHPVELVGMQAVKRCQAPLNGTLFYSPPAGASFNIGIGFNLDAVDSIAQNYQAYQISGDYFAAHTISLAPDEVQTLQVMAHTTRQYCQFTLELTVVDGSKQTTEFITGNGKPFNVTSTRVPFSYYKALYVGGVAPGAINSGFVPKNPATYQPS
jgi:hypothetical protein